MSRKAGAPIDGSRIRKLRRERELSQEQLAEKIGVTKQAISMAERGTRNLSTYNLNLLAAFFDVSVDYLLGRTPEFSVLDQGISFLQEQGWVKTIDGRVALPESPAARESDALRELMAVAVESDPDALRIATNLLRSLNARKEEKK